MTHPTWAGAGLALSVALASAMPAPALAQTLRDDGALFDRADGVAGARPLKGGSAVKVLRRQGFWVEVEAGGSTGWLKASSLQFAAARGGPVAIDTGRTGSGNIVATSAARGLSSQDLQQGQADLAALVTLDAAIPDAAALKAFRSQGQVTIVAAVPSLRAARSRPQAASESRRSAADTVAGATPADKGKGKNGDDW